MHIAGVRRRFWILALDLQLDIGAILTLAGGPEHRLGIAVKVVESQAANRNGNARLCWLAEG